MEEEDSLEAAKADVDAATGCRSRARSPSRMRFRIATVCDRPGQNEGDVGPVAGENSKGASVQRSSYNNGWNK